MKFYRTSLKTQQTTLLIDADLYLYRACAAAEQEIQWSDDVWSLWADLKVAKDIFRNNILDFCAKFETDQVLLTISDKENFRKDIYPEYKSNRKKTRKPVGYKALVQWARDTYDNITVPKLEADDVLGIIGSTPGSNTIIISDDKDMMSIPCRLYRPQSEERMTIDQDEADKNWLMQALTGDPTDGYPGLKGCGKVTAAKILGSRPSWDLVAQAYAKKDIPQADAVVQAQLARILRHTDWDTKTESIKLWEPSNASPRPAT